MHSMVGSDGIEMEYPYALWQQAAMQNACVFKVSSKLDQIDMRLADCRKRSRAAIMKAAALMR